MRVFAGLSTVALLAGFLTACARDPNVNSVGIMGNTSVALGRWVIDRQVDRITGKQIAYVSMRATKTTTDQQDNNLYFARNILLELTCFRDVPTARLAFNEYVGSETNSTLAWRFDDKPGKETEARILRDYKTVIIDQPAEMRPFIEGLATSKTLYVRVVSLNNARNSAEFDVEGGAQAVSAAYADCPFPEPEPAPPPKLKRKRARTT